MPHIYKQDGRVSGGLDRDVVTVNSSVLDFQVKATFSFSPDATASTSPP